MAAAAFVRPQFSPWDYWLSDIRTRLQARRLKSNAPKYGSIPRPAWLVPQAHSDIQQSIYELLQDVGRGRIAEAASGACPAVRGKSIGEQSWEARASVGWIAHRMKRPAATIAWNLAQLRAKHSVRLMVVRTRGDQSEGNREASVWILPHYRDVLAARRADPQIATTHAADPEQSLNWTNGRANSRRLLTPDQADAWGLDSLPGRPKAQAAAPRADPESLNLARSPATSPDPASPDPPASIDRQSDARSPRRAAASAVPAAMQAQLDELVSMVEGAALKVDPATNRIVPITPQVCDLAGDILAAAQGHAAELGKEFPASMLAELCGWFFEKKSKKHKVHAYDETRRDYVVREAHLWTADQPSAFLLRCASNREKPDALFRAIDTHEARAKKAQVQARRAQDSLRADIANAIGLLRKHPGDATVLELAANVSRAAPELFNQLWVADDVAHGGDGRGSSFPKPP